MPYLPYYYQKAKLPIEIENTIGKELGIMGCIQKEVIDQLFLGTATWGLETYEKDLNLPVNNALTYEERREILRAYYRGHGTTTKEMLKHTAESFSGGEVDIIEKNSEYYFIVKFIGHKGVPKNMKNFLEMLERIKPAHLNYKIEYTYITWEHLSKYKWGDLSNKTWGEVRTDNSLII